MINKPKHKNMLIILDWYIILILEGNRVGKKWLKIYQIYVFSVETINKSIFSFHFEGCKFKLIRSIYLLSLRKLRF